MDHDELLKGPDAARYLKLEPQTLRSWRVAGRGPRFIRIGRTRVLYRLSDIERWLGERQFESTSQESASANAG